MLPPVYALLSAAPAVTALVADRIERNRAAENTQAPYIVWRVIRGTPHNYVGDVTSIDGVRVQIDCWGKPAEAQAVAKAVRAALQPHAVEVGFFDDEDPDVKLTRFCSDWRFQTPR
jgi:hypothetical protein